MLNISTMPPRVRQVIYYVFAIAGIAFGATEIAIGDPHWLTVAMTVLSFVGASIGVTAGIHTPAGKNAPESGANAKGGQTATDATGGAQEATQAPTASTPADTAYVPARSAEPAAPDSTELPTPDGGGSAEVISGDTAPAFDLPSDNAAV